MDSFLTRTNVYVYGRLSSRRAVSSGDFTLCRYVFKKGFLHGVRVDQKDFLLGLSEAQPLERWCCRCCCCCWRPLLFVVPSSPWMETRATRKWLDDFEHCRIEKILVLAVAVVLVLVLVQTLRRSWVASAPHSALDTTDRYSVVATTS